MNQPFKSSEVRVEIAGMQSAIDNAGFGPEGQAAFASYAIGNIGKWKRMVTILADRLEADEKAVPVYQHRRKDGPIRRWFDCSADEYDGMDRNTYDKEHFDRRILYTHPSPSDAERLAEALRDDEHEWPASLNIRDTKLHDDMGGPGQRIYTTAGRGYKTMKYIRHDLAQSAQAQPPVASVPDAMPEVRVNADEVEFGELRSLEDACWNAGWNACRASMLAAQENSNG